MTKTRVGATICISDLENSEYVASLYKIDGGSQTAWTPRGCWAVKEATGVHVSDGPGDPREKQWKYSGTTPVAQDPGTKRVYKKPRQPLGWGAAGGGSP